VLGLTAFAVVGLAVGHVMGGPDVDRSVVLAFACAGSNRTIWIALTIAQVNFQQDVAGVIILFVLISGLVSNLYVRLVRRARPATAAALGDAASPAPTERARRRPSTEPDEEARHGH
jgi:hypothetical protein